MKLEKKDLKDKDGSKYQSGNNADEKEKKKHLSNMENNERKNCQSRLLHPQKSVSKKKGEIKTFSHMCKLEFFCTTANFEERLPAKRKIMQQGNTDLCKEWRAKEIKDIGKYIERFLLFKSIYKIINSVNKNKNNAVLK